MTSFSSDRRSRKNKSKVAKAAASRSNPVQAESAGKTRFTFTFNRQGKAKEEIESETLETIENLYDISPAPAAETGEDVLPTSEGVEVIEPGIKQSRSGRTIKAPQHIDDYVLGSELDAQVDLQSEQDGDFTTRARITSSPPVLLSAPRYNDQRKLNLRYDPGPNTDTPPYTDFLQDVGTDIYDIFQGLKADSTVLIDLPDLTFKAPPNLDADSDADEDDQVHEPYSASYLMQLYILAHTSRSWNICDLVADTWIRAFHARRTQASKDPRLAIWRPNRVLEKRMQIDPRAGGPQHFDTKAPEYGLVVKDPLLAPDVTEFNSNLLNVLFNNTSSDCGARKLWADVLTLCGDAAGSVIEAWRKQGVLSRELESEMLAVSLRMVRRNLTLKIEEVTEGAYCERYHEHGKYGLPCYRKLAFEDNQVTDAAGETDDDVEMVDGDRF